MMLVLGYVSSQADLKWNQLGVLSHQDGSSYSPAEDCATGSQCYGSFVGQVVSVTDLLCDR